MSLACNFCQVSCSFEKHVQCSTSPESRSSWQHQGYGPGSLRHSIPSLQILCIALHYLSCTAVYMMPVALRFDFQMPHIPCKDFNCPLIHVTSYRTAPHCHSNGCNLVCMPRRRRQNRIIVQMRFDVEILHHRIK